MKTKPAPEGTLAWRMSDRVALADWVVYISFVACTYLVIGCVALQASPPAPNEKSSPYRSKPLLRVAYLEGYSTALREKLMDLAYGNVSIINYGTARTEKEKAWFAGYRDGIVEGAEFAQKLYERQLRESKNGD